MRVSRMLTAAVAAVALSVLVAPAVPVSAAPATAPATAANTIGLHGDIVGRWEVMPGTLADAGVHYRLFRGYGSTSLGITGARGETGSLGNVRFGTCLLNLRVTTATPLGQISVVISSLDQFPAGASCKGYNFRWHSTRTTGVYAGRFGSGTGSFAMHNPTAPGADGTFKIYFH